MTFLEPLLVLCALPAPVTSVTVFTDQARVTRQLQAPGGGALEFPPLPDAVDPDSVRVETSAGEVRRVDLERLSPESFRTAEAKQLLTELDANEQERGRLAKEHTAFLEQRAALQRLKPVLPPNDNVRPAAKLSAAGWNQALQFQGSQLEALNQRLRETERAQRETTKQRDELLRRAMALGNPERASGWKVVAVLASPGPAVVSLTYLVRNARWTPAWDVQLDPEKSLVTLSLAGNVTQASGEDWDDAQLTLSTAVPSSAVKAPKLLTWKLGTSERFIPTPTPVVDVVRPMAQRPTRTVSTSEETLVRVWLARVANVPAGRAEVASLEEDERRQEPPRPAPSVMPAAPPPPPAKFKKKTVVDFSDTEIQGELAKPEGAFVISSTDNARDRASAPPPTPFSLSAPRGFVAPSFGADSPVTLAQGYDLTFASKQRESVPSGKGTRRVALWSQQWPVTVTRKVYPALARDAYLTAELKNPSQQVLPGGPASLSVGADPAGTAQLKLVSPGEAVTLPLGLDRALKTVRNVQVVDETQGVITKEDLSTYTVTIELVNPYRAPVELTVFDQWPLAQPNQKDTETKLLDSKPGAILDTATGKLEWRVTLKPNEKQVLSFRYQVKRPKSWRLYQQEVRP